ncbi:hypothetical protein [Nonlabens marinus]|uniref:Molybdopterin oxidoreductase n=1 Tax=Nonlabens marinus S1-08 TaxID=1454201 RepID=W8W0F9_9FLAO|nr:hypothetical protein [Nonlabens marinus]BAO56256.1 molybdopterin oxidoreductase [Nonlabens marinus S1-08]
MEDFNLHLPYYAIIAAMLLGAFLIGYFFGGRSQKTIVVKTEQVKVPLSPNAQTEDQKSEPKASKAQERIDIDELSRPGPVRAMKTRERSGSLSSDAKTTIIEEKLDFSTLGRGDRHNKDDFQKIVGIGPFVEEKLNEIGIYNYSQLSNMTDQDMLGITQLIDFFPGRIHRDDWKGQAAALLIEKKKEKN